MAAALRIVRERQDERLLGRQSSDGSLQDLHDALVEQRDLRCRLSVLSGQRKLHRFCSGAERLKILHPIALRHGVRHIRPRLAALAQAIMATTERLQCHARIAGNRRGWRGWRGPRRRRRLRRSNFLGWEGDPRANDTPFAGLCQFLRYSRTDKAATMATFRVIDLSLPKIIFANSDDAVPTEWV